ncbi:MAG TPA: SLBB domain-containing protein [Gemmatimonadaceae bacterium]
MRVISPFAIAILIGCVAVVPTVSSAQVDTVRGSTVRPGDHLKITVLGDDKNLGGEFEVAPDSTLKHPLYNRVKVVGVPLPLLRERIGSFLRTFQREPQFEVEPLFKVSVGGAVRSPGMLFLAPETPITDAVSLSGGLTDRGDPNRVTLLRAGRELSISLKGGDPNGAMLIQSGDQISVGESKNITGTVVTIISVVVSLASLFILSHR